MGLWLWILIAFMLSFTGAKVTIQKRRIENWFIKWLFWAIVLPTLLFLMSIPFMVFKFLFL